MPLYYFTFDVCHFLLIFPAVADADATTASLAHKLRNPAIGRLQESPLQTNFVVLISKGLRENEDGNRQS
jgi:hypothetical protein